MYSGLKMTMLSLFCAALLAGCGVRGSLKTPPPLFGNPTVDADRVPDSDLSGEAEKDALERLDEPLDEPLNADFDDTDASSDEPDT